MQFYTLTPRNQYLRLFRPSLEGQNFPPSQGETLKKAKNDHFQAKITQLVIFIPLNAIFHAILHPNPKKSILETF